MLSRKKWSEIKKMNKEELVIEFANLAKEIEQLSKHIGQIRNDEEEEEFSADVAYCINTLHSLRTKVLGFYFYQE